MPRVFPCVFPLESLVRGGDAGPELEEHGLDPRRRDGRAAAPLAVRDLGRDVLHRRRDARAQDLLQDLDARGERVRLGHARQLRGDGGGRLLLRQVGAELGLHGIEDLGRGHGLDGRAQAREEVRRRRRVALGPRVVEDLERIISRELVLHERALALHDLPPSRRAERRRDAPVRQLAAVGVVREVRVGLLVLEVR